MMLDHLGLGDHGSEGSVSILVGPNGSGKSSFLRDLAIQCRSERNIVIVCNTPHDRFSGLRGVRRIAVGKIEGSPRVVVKKAVAESLAGSGATFFQISSALEYCGYRARFGFRIEPGMFLHMSPDQIRSQLRSVVDRVDDSPYYLDPKHERLEADLEIALAFLQRHDPSEPIWIDASEKTLDFSRAREFGSVLRLESKLRARNVLRGIGVYLQRIDDGDIVEMHHASSGQLALISSLLFLITNAGESPIVIIDEPENSLHPNWQREYIDQVLTALRYYSPTVIVATHAPLVVTGALADSSDLVSVFEIRHGRPQRLPIDRISSSQSSIEEILWRAFEVVTPANHFVSERLVDEVSRFERGEIRKEEVLALIGRMEGGSFDIRQRSFFTAVKGLLDKVEENQSTRGRNDR